MGFNSGFKGLNYSLIKTLRINDWFVDRSGFGDFQTAVVIVQGSPALKQ